MPAALPRGRKSMPDPDLYAAPSSDDDDQDHHHHPAALPPARRTAAATKPPASSSAPLTRRGTKGPQPVRGTVITETGRRRSSRLSAEHPPSTALDAPVATRPTAAPARSKKRTADDPPTPPTSTGDAPPRPSARPAASASSASSSKRPRLAAAPPPHPEPSSSQHARSEPVASSSHTAPGPSSASSVLAGAAAAPPARRGFVPRALAELATRVHKPPPTYGTLLVDHTDPDEEGEGDAETGAADPFPFTTNPPTPHAKRKTNASSAPQGKGKTVQKTSSSHRPDHDRPTADDDDDNEDHTPDPGALPHPSHSTSTRRARPPPTATPPRATTSTQPREGRAALPIHETPVQVKNILFRAGAGPGTPASAGRGGGVTPGTVSASARRNSVRGSGKRGSSIGGGFEAVPHPQVADDKLYRSTDASDPLAKRLRALLSWASQRTRARVLAPSGLGEGGAGDDAERAAREVVDAWVEDVCRLRVDTSVPFSEPSTSDSPASLPPHPQNEANAARLAELEAAYAAIAQEQARRHALEPTYSAFFERRAAALAAASAPDDEAARRVQPPWTDPVAFARTLDTTVKDALLALPAAGTKSSVDDRLSDARALGRRILAQDPALFLPPPPTTPSSSSSSAAAPAAEPTDPAVQHAHAGTAALAHAAHRIEGLVRAASAYVALRGRQTHAALAQLGVVVSASSSAPTSGAGAGAAPTGAAQPATASRSAPTTGLGAAVGPGLRAAAATTAPTAAAEDDELLPSTAAAAAATGPENAQLVVDPRDLLRAIAGADTRGGPKGA